MPRYYVPPAPGTVPVRRRSSRWPPLLLAVGVLLLVGLLTLSGHELPSALAMGAFVLLYLLIVWAPYLLIIGGMLYLVSHIDRLLPRRSPPRPAPRWLWQPWEILLCSAALLLAVLWYAVADGSQWLRRRWRRRRAVGA